MKGQRTKLAAFVLVPPKSLYYQYRFYGLHGRWPSDDETKGFWTEELRKRGVAV